MSCNSLADVARFMLTKEAAGFGATLGKNLGKNIARTVKNTGRATKYTKKSSFHLAQEASKKRFREGVPTKSTIRQMSPINISGDAPMHKLEVGYQQPARRLWRPGTDVTNIKDVDTRTMLNNKLGSYTYNSGRGSIIPRGGTQNISAGGRVPAGGASFSSGTPTVVATNNFSGSAPAAPSGRGFSVGGAPKATPVAPKATNFSSGAPVTPASANFSSGTPSIPKSPNFSTGGAPKATNFSSGAPVTPASANFSSGTPAIPAASNFSSGALSMPAHTNLATGGGGGSRLSQLADLGRRLQNGVGPAMRRARDFAGNAYGRLNNFSARNPMLTGGVIGGAAGYGAGRMGRD